MSYLEQPRLVFSGGFQADVSTVNNDVRHYDNEVWSDAFQQMGEPRQPDGWKHWNGWWNPDGTGNFQLIDASVTGAELGGGASSGDPVLALQVVSNIDRPPAKLVDLDPQFQMGSMIWGLQLVLTDGTTEYLRGDFEPAPFRDLFFFRIDRQPGSRYASAKFTSRLTNLVWGESAASSPLLSALRDEAQANGGCLSANLMTFAYETNAPEATYTLGRMVGALGPWREGDPNSFVLGRRFAPVANNVMPFGTAQDNIGFFDAVVAGGRASVDLGNALPMTDRSGALVDLGTLSLVVLKTPDEVAESGGTTTLTAGIAEGATVTPADYLDLGEIPYRDPDWLTRTAGIASLAIDDAAAALAAKCPLALVVTDSAGASRVAIRETIGSFFVRADDFERRVDAATAHPVSTEVTLYCARFGQPLPGAAVQLQLAAADATQGANGNPPTGVDPKELDPLPKVVPTINVPATAIRFEATATTGADGVATLAIELDDPKNVRGYIDGQIFTIIYNFGFAGESAMPMFEQILLHVRDGYDPPILPDWMTDVAPVLVQFGNLYPIMSRGLFSFSDPEVVKAHAGLMMFALDRPIEDPNHMPATRDMSAGKRQMLLNWLAVQAGSAPPAPIPGGAPLEAAPAASAAAPLPAAPVGASLPADYSRFQTMKGMGEVPDERAAQPAGPDDQ